MTTLEERREARMAKLAVTLQRRIERQMRKTPGEYLGSWKRPITSDAIPQGTVGCSGCGKLFVDEPTWSAHRVHLDSAIERCCLGYELGACGWDRTLAGVWRMGLRALRSTPEHRATHARMRLEQLATVRSERETHALGERPVMHFPPRPAHAWPAQAVFSEETAFDAAAVDTYSDVSPDRSPESHFPDEPETQFCDRESPPVQGTDAALGNPLPRSS